jgi:hypothetical protein
MRITAASGRLLAMAGAVALVLAFAPPAAAQMGTQFSDTQISAFAEAARDVGELQQLYDARLQEADSAEQVQQLQEQAQAEMVQAVEASGLTPEEYNQILQAAHQDEQLYTQIVEQMQMME